MLANILKLMFYFFISLYSLVSGDVEGKFDQLFARINSIQKKSGIFDVSRSKHYPKGMSTLSGEAILPFSFLAFLINGSQLLRKEFAPVGAISFLKE